MQIDRSAAVHALALAFAAACSTVESARTSNELFPGGVPLDGRGLPAWAVTCVVDAENGAPIRGARMSAVLEPECPISGEWWEERSALSDQDGWVRLRMDDIERDPWLFVDADGYAPYADFTRYPEPLVRLERGTRVDVLVRDAFDRPVGDAEVGLLLGCGHTPDVRVARSDARDGLARFEGVAPGHGELWTVAPGLRADYRCLPDAPLGIVRLEPAVDVRGRVVGADGQPVAGVFVGAPHVHRGPWARTDAQGRFELLGVGVPAEVTVREGSRGGRHLGYFRVPHDGRSVTLTVPLDESEASAGALVLARASGSESPIEGLSLTLVREGDGRTARGRTGARGLAELEVPPGAYALTAGGGFSGWDPIELSLFVGADGAAPELELAPSPRVALRADALPDGARVILVTAMEEHDVTGDARSGEPLAVPREGPCALRVELADRARVELLSPERRTLGAPIELRAPRPLAVRFALAAPDGGAARGIAFLSEGDELDEDESEDEADALARSGPSGELELETFLAGRAWLWIVPADPLQLARRVPVVLSAEEDVLELGTLRFADARTARLVVLESDGAPAADAVVELRRDGEVARLPLAPDGSLPARLWTPRAGDFVRIEGEAGHAFQTELRGEGPWTISRPSSSIEIEAVDDAGRPLERFSVWIDGELIDAEGGTATVRSVAPGPRRLVVAASGHEAALLRIDLARDEHRRMRAVLPRAPATH